MKGTLQMYRPIAFLRMRGIPTQGKNHAGIGASYLQIDSTGPVDAACQLFGRVTELIVSRQIEQGAVPGLDTLQAEALAEKLRSHLAAIPAMSDPGLNP